MIVLSVGSGRCGESVFEGMKSRTVDGPSERRQVLVQMEEQE